MEKKCWMKTMRWAAWIVVGMMASATAQDHLFNFGPDGAVEDIPGWTHAGTTRYTPERGWGWETLPDVIRKRDMAPNPVEDTAVGVSPRGAEAVFRVDLEPGLYEVSTGRGDAAHPANTTVYLNQDITPWADRGRLRANEFVGFTRTVWVRDGILRLRIPPRAVAGEPFNMVNWLWVQPVDPQRVPLKPRGQAIQLPTAPVVPGFTWPELQAKITPFDVDLSTVQRRSVPADRALVFNFGPGNLELPPDVIAVSTQPFSAERGWGWLNAPCVTRRRRMDDDVLKDTMVGVSDAQPRAEFIAVLGPGTYRIEVMQWDAQYTYTAQLFVQEEPELWIADGTVRSAQQTVRERTVTLDDGVLRLRIPGNAPFTMLNYLRIIAE